MTKTIDVTDEDMELLHCDSIASQLPIKFDTGWTFTGVEGKCAGCSQPIVETFFNGRVLRPTSKVADIYARGYCDGCKLVTPFRFRVYEDYRFLTLQNDGWREAYMRKEEPKGVFSTLRRAVRWLFTF